MNLVLEATSRQALSVTQEMFTGSSQSVSVTRHDYVANGTRRGVLVCGGGGSDAATVLTGDVRTHNMDEFAANNYPTIIGNLAGTNLYHFGNDTAVAGLASLWAFGKASRGFKTDKFGASGGSMGALAVLNYLISLADPASVCAGVILVIPVLDLDSIYQSATLGYRDEVETAYGVTYPTAIPNLATHSPVAYSSGNKAKLTMPIKIWASDNDTTASNTAACQTWAATLPNCTVVSMGNQGHVDPGTYTSDRLNFLAPLLAAA